MGQSANLLVKLCSDSGRIFEDPCNSDFLSVRNCGFTTAVYEHCAAYSVAIVGHFVRTANSVWITDRKSEKVSDDNV